MPNCPKCGAEVSEEMSFCPRCGAPLKVGQFPPPPPPPAGRKEEKAEKREKEEKGEKWEKYEKRELVFLGPLIGGIILLMLGILSYLEVTGLIERGASRAILLIVVGVIVLVGALYVVSTAPKRHPKP
ncbi:MAG: zinc ribbon domain-containing protein [Candidatus Bathyarchaeia archaeon]